LVGKVVAIHGVYDFFARPFLWPGNVGIDYLDLMALISYEYVASLKTGYLSAIPEGTFIAMPNLKI
jgi:hypothetical protein